MAEAAEPDRDANPPLVLASSSPRRRVLLAMIGVEVEVIAPDIDEDAVAGDLPPVDAVVAVARAKAGAIAGGGRPVLAADTAVVCDGRPLGKPRDDADARRMLQLQMGREIEVITGVAVAGTDVHTAHAVSRVRVDRLDADALDEYIATGEPFDKAGALAVQGAARDFTEVVAGSKSNVYGLPLDETIRLLQRVGVATRRRATGPGPA